MALLEVKNLSYVYGENSPFSIKALRDVSVGFDKGELVAVIGQTGSGKSTLLMHLNGLLKPASGDVLFDGKSIFESKRALRNARFNVGLCFQYPEHQLFEATVRRDIAFGPKNMGLSDAEVSERVLWAASLAGFPEELLDKSPFDLSGGEKRRAAIAGVMAMRPGVLILDEPTAGLDPGGSADMLRLIEEYNKNTGSTVIFVSHDMDAVARLAKRVLVMNKGEVAAFDTPERVFSDERVLGSGLDVPEITRILTCQQCGSFARFTYSGRFR